MAARNGGRFFSARQRRTVEAFADVFIDGPAEAIAPWQIADHLDAHLAGVRSKRVKSLRWVLRGVEWILPLTGRRLPPFSRLSAEQRRALIDRRLARAPRGSLGRSVAKLRALFLAGYYEDAAVHRSIGFTPVEERRPPPERTMMPRRQIERRALRRADKVDLCVVGSGAAGGVLAGRAAAAGLSVALVEEGEDVHAAQIRHHEGAMSSLLYKEGGLQTTVDLGMSILQGRALGGTTVINNAICFPLYGEGLNPAAPDVLASWEPLGATLDRAALARSFARVRKEIGVARISEVAAGQNGRLFVEGWEALVRSGLAERDWPCERFEKNFNDCVHCGYCNFGCRYGRRMSVVEAYLTKAAERESTRVLTGCHAVGVEMDGDTARAVRVEEGDGERRIEARTIVLCCGAIGSSVLLLKSGIARNVGTRFSFNAGTPVLARFPQPVHGWDGDQMAAYVDSGSYLMESTFNPPVTTSIALPGWFGEHFRRMKDYDRLTGAGVLIGTEPTGTVKRLGLLRDLLGPVSWTMGRRDLATLREGMSMLAALWLAAGAEVVWPSTFADAPLERERFVNGRPDLPAIRAHMRAAAADPRDLTLSSAHPQGGNPMSDRPEIGVVDGGFRVHGTRNLHVCDASVFPTSIRVNPQLTIMAMADYAWETALAPRT